MVQWLEQFFQRRTDGNGLVLRGGISYHHQTTAGVYVYPDRPIIIDTFPMIETMIAKYTVVCESQKVQPHKLDTFELTVLANRNSVVFTIFGRVFTDRKLVDIEIEQDNNFVYLKATEIDYGGSDNVKVSLIKNYVDTSGTT
jgi:hypothetical protein